MDIVANLRAELEPAAILKVLADLGTYPDWLDIVGEVAAEPVSGDVEAAWIVELRAQLGPIRRSKRLRMVRTALNATSVRFERAEVDGRLHSSWVLDASVSTPPPGPEQLGPITELEMRLHYGGSLWAPLLERVVGDEIQRSRPRLVEVVAARSGRPSAC